MSLPMYQHKMDLIPKRKKIKKQFNLFIKKKKKKQKTRNDSKIPKKRIINFSMATILQMWAIICKEAH